MKVNKTIKYLEKRLEYLNKLVSESREKRDIFNIEKEELFTQIEDYKDKIDEAYDVFSPKSTKNDFIKEQIHLFETRLNQINENIEELQEKIESGEEEIEEIEKARLELKIRIDETDEIIGILNEIEKEREAEIDCIDITKTDDMDEYDEYRGDYDDYDEYDEYNPMVSEKIEVKKKKIRDIIYKCENCSAFMELDINRCKVEINNVVSLLNDLLRKT